METHKWVRLPSPITEEQGFELHELLKLTGDG